MKKLLLSLFVLPLCAMELQRIHDHNIMKLNGTTDSELYRDIHGFQVNDHGQFKRIKSHRLTEAVRKIKENPEALDYFLKNKGYLKLTQNEEGEYALDADGKIIGGGPILGGILYWGTKAFCYGLALAGTGAVVATSGGAAGAISGAYVAGITTGASTGATVVAGAVAGAGLTTEAAMATSGIIASSGGLAGAVAFVEFAASFMGTAGLLFPWL